MSQKSSLLRTIEILKHLNEGKQLCVTRLAQEYEVSDCTILSFIAPRNLNKIIKQTLKKKIEAL